jgi:hypothetical protein
VDTTIARATLKHNLLIQADKARHYYSPDRFYAITRIMNTPKPRNEISVIIPDPKRELEPIERLIKLADKRERSFST